MLVRETLFSRVYQACKEWKGWMGRQDFFGRMELVRQIVVMTIENRWPPGRVLKVQLIVRKWQHRDFHHNGKTIDMPTVRRYSSSEKKVV